VTLGYLDVDAGTPVTIQGTYGVLTLEADGDYTYAPDTSQAYFDTPQVDTFEYQLVHPGGDVAQGTLEVTVEPSGAGIPVPLMASSFAFEADTVLIDALDSDGDGQADGAETTGFFEFDMLEGQGSVEDVLENYLRESELDNDAADDAAGPVPISVREDAGATATFEDPLSYLSSTSDLSTEDQLQNNSLI
jgi:VCBS repeat-containing protein